MMFVEDLSNFEETKSVASLCGGLKQYLSGYYSTSEICCALYSTELDPD